MGLSNCSCKDEEGTTIKNTFGFLEKKRIVQPQECTEESPVVVCEVKSSALVEEARDTVTLKPLKIQRKTPGGGTPRNLHFRKAKSCIMDNRTLPKLRRGNSAPSALSIYYSTSTNVKEQALHIHGSLLGNLTSKKPRAQSLSQRFQIRRKSSTKCTTPEKKPKKKVRFDDNVIIHRIEATAGMPTAMPETYKLVITIRQVWLQLDLDRDKHLNINELQRFCSEVWEEPDSNVYNIMECYAKADPDKGINFNEWCSLIKDEDPDLKQFVDDLYSIFVEDSGTSS